MTAVGAVAVLGLTSLPGVAATAPGHGDLSSSPAVTSARGDAKSSYDARSVAFKGRVGGQAAAAAAKSVGLGVIGFADAFVRLRPDIIVLLGDRFELLAAAQAAMLMRIPIAHIHGGEASEGAVDESIRHAITKLSHLHLVATEESRERVVRMGEVPGDVYIVGAPSLDDVVALAQPVLRHRMALNFSARAEGVDLPGVIDGLVGAVV